MFVHYSLRNNVSYKAIAMLVVAALLTWTVGAQLYGQVAEAANVTNFSDTLSDSTSGATSDHTIDYTTANGMVTTETFVLVFESFDLTALDSEDDIEVAINGAATTSAAAAAGVGQFRAQLATPDAQSITFTSPTDGVASSSRITILIGQGVTGGDQDITNPTATTTSYTVDIAAGTVQDTGQTRVAITDSVLVTASVDTNFDFVVSGTPIGYAIPGVATTTATNTNSSQLSFGTLTADTSVTLAQQLNVTTNAANGFVVTVEQSQDLQSETGAIIDSFTDGTYVDTPTAWVDPGDNILDNTTWGHWGMTSDDDGYNAGVNDRWIAASTTPRTVFDHNSSADGLTDDVGSTTVGFQIQITPLQEAGNDYSTTLTYIATPTF